jgi:hypothetical protein
MKLESVRDWLISLATAIILAWPITIAVGLLEIMIINQTTHGGWRWVMVGLSGVFACLIKRYLLPLIQESYV